MSQRESHHEKAVGRALQALNDVPPEQPIDVATMCALIADRTTTRRHPRSLDAAAEATAVNVMAALTLRGVLTRVAPGDYRHAPWGGVARPADAVEALTAMLRLRGPQTTPPVGLRAPIGDPSPRLDALGVAAALAASVNALISTDDDPAGEQLAMLYVDRLDAVPPARACLAIAALDELLQAGAAEAHHAAEHAIATLRWAYAREPGLPAASWLHRLVRTRAAFEEIGAGRYALQLPQAWIEVRLQGDEIEITRFEVTTSGIEQRQGRTTPASIAAELDDWLEAETGEPASEPLTWSGSTLATLPGVLDIVQHGDGVLLRLNATAAWDVRISRGSVAPKVAKVGRDPLNVAPLRAEPDERWIQVDTGALGIGVHVVSDLQLLPLLALCVVVAQFPAGTVPPRALLSAERIATGRLTPAATYELLHEALGGLPQPRAATDPFASPRGAYAAFVDWLRAINVADPVGVAPERLAKRCGKRAFERTVALVQQQTALPFDVRELLLLIADEDRTLRVHRFLADPRTGAKLDAELARRRRRRSRDTVVAALVDLARATRVQDHRAALEQLRARRI